MPDATHHPVRTVRAAGGVLVDEQGRIAVVWRPHRRDWSLPKGKQDPSESDEETAQREVLEETGYTTRLIADLGTVEYVDHRDRPKVVRYFLLELVAGSFDANDEVSELVWLEPTAALARLTYDTDRVVIERMLASITPD